MEEGNNSLLCPFWIDTDGYSDRDRLMFCCGVEFYLMLNQIMNDPRDIQATVNRENESRIRLASARFNRKCHIKQSEDWDDPKKQWSYVFIEAQTR